ncbi:hypothetical protein [Lapillicoccus sp.]|uniref:hypothetical protein n=1 Tax=Lapillicoccus sp. TaxID=1909287 RepID=UPI0025F38E81|nr:hypothetical protein [Lapillicoccus sp.]
MPAPLMPVLVYAEAVPYQLQMPPYAFALIAFGAFLAGLGVLWSFRNTASKVAAKQRPGTSGPSRPAGQGGGDHGQRQH